MPIGKHPPEDVKKLLKFGVSSEERHFPDEFSC